MTTPAKNGVNFLLFTSPDGGVTYHLIAGAKKATLKRQTANIDTTTKDDNGDESNQAGKRSWTVDFDQLWVSADAGQLDIQAAQAAGTTLQIKLEYQNTPGDTYIGTCIVTDISEDMPDNEAVTFTGSLRGSGSLTKAGNAH